jgi:Nucleotidyl transferase AbiEii toxin, Type IV TA system
VQTQPQPIGTTVDAIRDALSWLGKCNSDQTAHSMHLVFKFVAEADAEAKPKLKVAISTRENEALYGIKKYPFEVDSGWYKAKTEIACFKPEELFRTKLRALLQRRKNRDLFDLNEGLKQLSMDPDKLISCFEHYLALEGKPISRAAAEERMLKKLGRSLTEGIAPLLPAGITFNEDDALVAFGKVLFELIARIKGEPWKLTDKALEGLRQKKYPNLLSRKNSFSKKR